MSSSVSPASFSAFGMAVTGPMPISSGKHPVAAYATSRASGLNPKLPRPIRIHQHHRRRSVRSLRGVARRHRSLRVKRRLQLGQRLRRCVRPRPFIGRKHPSPSPPAFPPSPQSGRRTRHRHRDQFIRQIAPRPAPPTLSGGSPAQTHPDLRARPRSGARPARQSAPSSAATQDSSPPAKDWGSASIRPSASGSSSPPRPPPPHVTPPARIRRSACATASRPEAHSRFTVTPGNPTGNPARSADHPRHIPALLALRLRAPQNHIVDLGPVQPRNPSKAAPIASAARSSGR